MRYRNLGLACLVLFAALGATSAQAQVYRCTVDGRVVFMDRPCAADTAPEAIRPAAGAYDPGADARARERTERGAATIAARDAERAEQTAEQRRQEAAAQAAAPLDRCDQLAKDHAEAVKWANRFRHPDNVARERAKAEHARERSFFECPPHRRVSQFR